jgi:8-oxo-dGTP diphosphatase
MDKKKIKVPTPKTRKTWKIKPVTRIKPSGKIYHRRQKDQDKEMHQEISGNKTAGSGKGGAILRFCPHCGGSLMHKEVDGKKRLVCSHCGFVFYQNPVPAVGMIIPQGEKIILVRRAEEPFRGNWCLPAGFLELDETPQECAVREAKEETGLDIRVHELFGVYPGQDDPRARVVLIIYLTEIVGGQLHAGDDASDAAFFGRDGLPQHIAFASHRLAIAEYFEGEDD